MNLNSMNDEERIVFAGEVDQFLKSRIARYLFDHAAENVDVAKNLLVAVDPDDAKAVRELQYEIRLNNAVGVWLYEVLKAGIDARDMMEDIR